MDASVEEVYLDHRHQDQERDCVAEKEKLILRVLSTAETRTEMVFVAQAVRNLNFCTTWTVAVGKLDRHYDAAVVDVVVAAAAADVDTKKFVVCYKESYTEVLVCKLPILEVDDVEDTYCRGEVHQVFGV